MNPIHFRNILITSIIVLSILVIVLIILLAYYGSKASKAIKVADRISRVANEITNDVEYIQDQLVAPMRNFIQSNDKKEPKTKFGQFMKALLSRWS